MFNIEKGLFEYMEELISEQKKSNELLSKIYKELKIYNPFQNILPEQSNDE